jgi:hypothetical protein
MGGDRASMIPCSPPPLSADDANDATTAAAVTAASADAPAPAADATAS